MASEQSLWDEINTFRSQAEKARERGKYSQAIMMLDKAITLGTDAGLDMFPMKIAKEVYMVESGEDRQSQMIALHRQAIETYQEKKNQVELLQTLINLTRILINQGDKVSALEYLIRAEALIDSMNVTDTRLLKQNFPPEYMISVEQFLKLRSAALAQLRQQLM